MSISVTCESCQKSYQLDDQLAGRQVRCRQCQEIIRVPGTKVRRELREDAQSAADSSEPKESRPKPIRKPAAQPSKAADDDDFNFDDMDFGSSDDEESESLGHACRKCGEPIERRAKECPHCGTVFDTGLKKKRDADKKKKAAKKNRAANAQNDESTLSATDYVVCILCTNIACLGAVIYLLMGRTERAVAIFKVVGIVYAIFFCIGFVYGTLKNLGAVGG